jgi:hypothetical protein
MKITPEMVGMRIGMFIGIEAKANGKRNNTSARQKQQLLAIEAAAGIGAVVSTQEDLIQLEDVYRACSLGEKGSALPFAQPEPHNGCDTNVEDTQPATGRVRRRSPSARRDQGST